MLTIVASVISGALAGAIAGWTVADYPYRWVERNANQITEETASSTGRAMEPEVTLVAIDPTTAEPIVPPAFAERRVSSVATVYKKPSQDQQVLNDQDVLGQAVSVTSDGWFVLPTSILGDIGISDIILWHGNRAYPIIQGVLDERGSVVFLKTEVSNVSAPAFARFQDVNRGLSVWVERTAGSFEPMSITRIFTSSNRIAGDLSNQVHRRLSVSGDLSMGQNGAPVWGMNGSLIGLMVDQDNGDGAECIPVSAWAPSLFGIFSDGKILHASLGVRGVDLSAIRLVNPPENLPERGVWLQGNEALNLPAIVPGSPAETAGLKEGDVILRVDRDILDGRADLAEILVQYKPHSQVTITINRNGEQLEIPVTLGSEQVSRSLQ